MELIEMFDSGLHLAAVIEDPETGERFELAMLTADDAPLGEDLPTMGEED